MKLVDLHRNTKMQNTTMPELLTLKEACDLLRVHPNTLRNWERDGKIQAIRIGTRRDRRFTKDSLLQVYEGALSPISSPVFA